jgi:hypothetical protein
LDLTHRPGEEARNTTGLRADREVRSRFQVFSGFPSRRYRLYAASRDRGDGFVIFNDFSARSPSYRPHALRWRHYEKHPPDRTGIGKLAKLAHQNGWRPPRTGS